MASTKISTIQNQRLIRTKWKSGYTTPICANANAKALK